MRSSFAAIAGALCVAAFLALPAVSNPTTDKPNAGEIIEAAMVGLDSDVTVKYVASSAGTAPENLITADLTAGQQTVRYQQLVVVENLSTAAAVCVCPTTWATACSATTCSCRGGSNPKSIVAPGKSREYRWAGTLKLCAVTSAADGEWQAERFVRLVGER